MGSQSLPKPVWNIVSNNYNFCPSNTYDYLFISEISYLLFRDEFGQIFTFVVCVNVVEV